MSLLKFIHSYESSLNTSNFSLTEKSDILDHGCLQDDPVYVIKDDQILHQMVVDWLNYPKKRRKKNSVNKNKLFAGIFWKKFIDRRRDLETMQLFYVSTVVIA